MISKSRHAWGAPAVEALPFLVLTLLVAALPLTKLLELGKRADALVPRLRDWMKCNSWIVSDAVIVPFLVITLRGLGRVAVTGTPVAPSGADELGDLL